MSNQRTFTRNGFVFTIDNMGREEVSFPDSRPSFELRVRFKGKEKECDFCLDVEGIIFYHAKGYFFIQSTKSIKDYLTRDQAKKKVEGYVRSLELAGFTVSRVDLGPPNQFGYRQIKFQVKEEEGKREGIIQDFHEWWKKKEKHRIEVEQKYMGL